MWNVLDGAKHSIQLEIVPVKEEAGHPRQLPEGFEDIGACPLLCIISLHLFFEGQQLLKRWKNARLFDS